MYSVLTFQHQQKLDRQIQGQGKVILAWTVSADEELVQELSVRQSQGFFYLTTSSMALSVYSRG
jgi:hypothetical protein